MWPLLIPIPIPIPFRTSYSQPSVVIPRYYQYQPTQSNVMVGNLPDDFLRIPSSKPTTQEEQDRAAAIHLQNQIISEARQPVVGRFEITFVNAVLNKNYGISRMDPYVRLRVGHHVYETHTVPNGAKNPYWNKTFQIYNLPQTVNSMHVEVFDERTLTEDELIAWTHISIPESIRQGEVVDDWFKLSGKLGDEMEGVIHIVMSYSTGPVPAAPPVMMLPGYTSSYPTVPIYTLPAAQHYALAPTYPTPTANPPMQRPPPEIKESDVTQLSEMFPSIESTAIKSVLEASSGNKEEAINSLLQMQ